MTEGNGGSSVLVKLDDFEGEVEEHWQEAKGRKVFDKNGDEIGAIEDLYIWEEPETVHLIKAEVEGKHVLIPLDAVTTAQEEGVEVEQDKGVISASPEFDSEDVPDNDTSRAAFSHYGYIDRLPPG